MAATQPPQQSRSFNNGYLPNGASPGGPAPGAQPLLPNQGRIIEQGATRILCVADVRGNLNQLNDLARSSRADCIIHTGDFGFYDDLSLGRIAEKTLKHVAQYSPLITEDVRRQVANAPPNSSIKQRFNNSQLPLSQLPLFLNNTLRFEVPVYSVWGACEDVQVLEKIRSGEYKIPNLHILDEENTRRLEVGGVKLRLLGLGGAVVMHKLFDNGEGRTTIAGGQGTMWTTFLQMGMLIGTANAAYDPSETRVLVTHASPSREGLLNQLAVHLKVDFSVSAGLHFRYGSSYNEFTVNPTFDHYRGKLAASRSSFYDVWETVKDEVEPVVKEDETQMKCLQNALSVVEAMPSIATSGGPFGGQSGGALGEVESAFKNLWNFNLSDAAFGYLVLEVDGGRVAAEMRSQGFNFGHRGVKGTGAPMEQAKAAVASPAPLPPAGVAPPPYTSGQHAQPRAQVPPTGPASQPQQQPSQNRPNQNARPQQNQQAPVARTPPVNSNAPTQAQQIQPVPTAKPTAQNQPPPVPPAQQSNQSQKANASTANGVTEKATSAESKTEGGNDAAANKQNASPAPVEKKPSQSLFVRNTNSDEEVRNLLAEADRSKIERLEVRQHFTIVHFHSPEEMKAVFEAVPLENKRSPPGKPNVRIYEERGRGGYQSSNWNNSNRGGPQQGGYRSGGASDSEGGRGGRGGFRGQRGGRGNDRGRGEGRGGGRGGRGGNKGAQGEGASPANTPAPSTGPKNDGEPKMTW